MSDGMWKYIVIGCMSAATTLAQPASSVEVANLREDVRGLTQRLGDLQLRLEQLERENTELRSRLASGDKNYVTTLQLSQAIDDLERMVRGAIAASKNDTLQHVAAQLEKLGKQTNAALDALAKTQVSRAPVPTSFSDDFAKEGEQYIVQKGDTVALIAKKTGARFQDIVNANKLADPSRIVVGQNLFIPKPPAGAAK